MHRTGLALGTFVGLIHLVWVLVLGLGGSGFITWVMGMHFISEPITFLTFSWKGGLVLIVLSAVVGYVVGNVFAYIWNRVYNR